MKIRAREFLCRGIGCCDKSKSISGRMMVGLGELVFRLEVERGGKDLEVRCVSGRSCEGHYGMIEGSERREHVEGNAIHIQVEGVTPLEVNAAALKVEVFRRGGIGLYERFVHLDVREDGGEWWKGKYPRIGKLGPKIMRAKRSVAVAK